MENWKDMRGTNNAWACKFTFSYILDQTKLTTRGQFHFHILHPMPIFCDLSQTFMQVKSLLKVGHRSQTVWRRVQTSL